MSKAAWLPTRKSTQIDDYHGDQVADPYRWLEDSNSEETRRWVQAQNQLTEEFLSQVPSRAELRQRLTEIWDYPTYSVPFERGGLWFQQRNSGLQDQSVYYVMASPDAEDARALLDPNVLSDDGSVSVQVVEASDDGALFAYATSEAGSDWATWRVRDVASGQDLPDVVDWCKNPHAAWNKDGSGFYYSATERAAPQGSVAGDVGLERIFLHRLGTAQDDDELVFEAPEEPEWLPFVMVSDDGRFVIIHVTIGTAPETRVEVVDLEAPGAGLRPLVDDFASLARVIGNVGETFLVLTDDDAERHRIVAVELRAPDRANWREIVPERGALLLGARTCGGHIVCHYLQDACSRLVIFDMEGNQVRDLDIPPVVAVAARYDESGIVGHAQKDLFQFELRSFADPGTLWSHNVKTGESKVLRRSLARIRPDQMVCEEVFVVASDGAGIPLFLTRRHDLHPNGEVPVLLYGYGGFNVPITPDFNRSDALFVERGGLLAVACLRGGGEYGKSWYEAGRLANKQRVFDDFCDCARWLVSSGWSTSKKIAINGASNGGLLVGACLVQHPELFGAAVPEVGVMDMLRFHKFTRGWAWKSDFGDPDDPEEYRWLRAYSPLQNIEPGTCYPPTLVTTGDHDDRVIPGHSYKFAAALQEAAPQGCASPVLIRVEAQTGHGAGKPTSKSIAERADVLAFLDAVLS
ncbi:MAG TPA: prolyl oligopeptidase family serine peptidase [Acidimicrobiales bacterium]|nr:prolyl oligopeptidase family serine peptidase [Acidimicrobiales bacterium]